MPGTRAAEQPDGGGLLARWFSASSWIQAAQQTTLDIPGVVQEATTPSTAADVEEGGRGPQVEQTQRGPQVESGEDQEEESTALAEIRDEIASLESSSVSGDGSLSESQAQEKKKKKTKIENLQKDEAEITSMRHDAREAADFEQFQQLLTIVMQEGRESLAEMKKAAEQGVPVTVVKGEVEVDGEGRSSISTGAPRDEEKKMVVTKEALEEQEKLLEKGRALATEIAGIVAEVTERISVRKTTLRNSIRRYSQARRSRPSRSPDDRAVATDDVTNQAQVGPQQSGGSFCADNYKLIFIAVVVILVCFVFLPAVCFVLLGSFVCAVVVEGDGSTSERSRRSSRKRSTALSRANSYDQDSGDETDEPQIVSGRSTPRRRHEH